jgi:hypothetical protein
METILSQFPLKPVPVFVSRYRHPRPRSYAGWLRSRGFEVVPRRWEVVVYHGPDEPDTERTPLSREPMRYGAERALNSWLRARLLSAGFVRAGQRLLDREPHAVAEGGRAGEMFAVHRHRGWRWSLTEVDGGYWLTPAPTRTSLSAAAPWSEPWASWLEARARPCFAVDLISGRGGMLERRGERWGVLNRKVWRPLEGDGWRVVLDSAAVAELRCGPARSTPELKQLIAALSDCAPLRGALASLTPRSVRDAGWVTGRHLRFARGRGQRPSDLRRLGFLSPPEPPLEVIVAAPAAIPEPRLRAILNVHLTPRERLLRSPRGRAALREVGFSARRPSLATCWGRHGLPALRVNPALALYRGDPPCFDGAAPRALAAAARAGGRRPVVLALLRDEAPASVLDGLLSQLEGCPVQPVCLSTLSKGPAALENLAVGLAVQAGGVPWSLVDLPEVDPGTLFLGLDLGHDHTAGRTRLGLTLMAHDGRWLASRVVPLPRNNERLDAGVLGRELPALLEDAGGPISRVIVHRDGRFHRGEVRALEAALSASPRCSLVAVKKDPLERFASGAAPGLVVPLAAQRALLLPRPGHPLEIELVRGDGLSLEAAVAQVFWLSRAWRGSLFQAARLPVTTAMADRLSATGALVRRRQSHSPPASDGTATVG